MATVSDVASRGPGHLPPSHLPSDEREGMLARLGLRFTNWAEHWFPDAYVFVCLAVAVVAVAALVNGATPVAIAASFGDGFWSLIVFTMQMVMVVVSGYVVATSPPAAKLIDALAGVPRSGRGAVPFVAAVSMLSSLLNWGMSLVFSGLLVRALARRTDLKMDYRAAGAAAYLGLGATWALGLSSSAAQLQANAASLPKPLLAITGVIPFAETIFLWQSMVIAAVLIVVSMAIALWSAPSAKQTLTAQAMDISVDAPVVQVHKPDRPGEWLEYSPIITLIVVALGGGWLVREFTTKDPIIAISNLNTYNLLFLMLGALLHWRPRNFLNAVAKAVPATTGVLIQFPLYGGIATMLTTAKGAGGLTVADQISHAFVALTTHSTFPVAMGIYSAVLGFFIPVRRRQVDHRGALRDAGGERPEGAPRLGGAGLQHGRSAAEPHQPLLDAAAARRAGLASARHRRLHLPAAYRPPPDRAVPAVAARGHADVYAAGRAAIMGPRFPFSLPACGEREKWRHRCDIAKPHDSGRTPRFSRAKALNAT
jgi:short-chain fatty acids transporter